MVKTSCRKSSWASNSKTESRSLKCRITTPPDQPRHPKSSIAHLGLDGSVTSYPALSISERIIFRDCQRLRAPEVNNTLCNGVFQRLSLKESFSEIARRLRSWRARSRRQSLKDSFPESDAFRCLPRETFRFRHLIEHSCDTSEKIIQPIRAPGTRMGCKKTKTSENGAVSCLHQQLPKHYSGIRAASQSLPINVEWLSASLTLNPRFSTKKRNSGIGIRSAMAGLFARSVFAGVQLERRYFSERHKMRWDSFESADRLECTAPGSLDTSLI